MADQELRDKHGALIGKIREMSGMLHIYDSHGTPKGKYDPKTNKTYDHTGALVGTGNLLVRLV